VHIRHDLSPFSQVPDNGSGDLGIDDLQLASTTVGVGDVPRAGLAPVELAAPSPNPSRGPVALTMRVSDASPIDLRILDVQGRQVRHQRLSGAAGIRVWTWDGRDQQGRLAPAGVYRVTATSKAGGTSRNLARIR
jgi:large repetitive protein